MENLNNGCYNPFFSHIYIEEAVMGHPRTKRVLEKFPDARVVKIGHYKDVFCRRGQDVARQRCSQNLILANKQGTLIYPGAPVCQDFGNAYFYYTSCVMNCIFDCEYCYLKGMYPSANMVLFVNLEDFFAETERMLARHPVYLCVSYDTDLLAFESVAGYAAEWARFAGRKGDLTIEIRTKSANLAYFKQVQPVPGVVYAFTLSPQEVIDWYEHGTPSFLQRVSCAKWAAQEGFPIRLCFDPMIYVPDWENRYGQMLEFVFAQIPAECVQDVSIGTFRVPQDYLKKMRRQAPGSAVVQFPYQNIGGVYQYPDGLAARMERFMADALSKGHLAGKLFLWKEKGSG